MTTLQVPSETRAARDSAEVSISAYLPPASPRRTPWLKRTGWMATVVAVFFAAWHGGVEDHFIAKRWGVVVPGKLYRSGQVSRHLIEPMLRSHEIKTVIDLNGFNRHNANQQVELAVAEYLEIDHHRFALSGDGTGSLDKYVDAIALIVERQRQGKPTLVHCGAGSNRTGGVIAVYRLLVVGDSRDDVQRELEAYDCTSGTNRKLVPFLNANMSAIAEKLAARGSIARVPDEIPQLRE